MLAKTFFLFFTLVVSTFASAQENQIIKYSARCSGQGFDLKTVTIDWDGSFERVKFMDYFDAGATNIKITRDEDGKLLLDTAGSVQKFFRQTEPGISFFGLYNGAVMTNPGQIVYLMMIYGQVSSIYWFMSAIKSGQDLQKSLDSTKFRLQAFADEDPSSTVSLQFQCNFSIK